MRGLQTHRVTIGDSLQKLARLYGIAEWQEIAELNGLVSPYIDANFPSDKVYESKVAKVGDTLLIPTLATHNAGLESANSDEIELAAYGSDLSLYETHTANSDFKGNLTEGHKDVLRVTGIENLAQQLNTRLTVKKGGLLLHPNYGSELYKYNGKNDSQENRNKIQFEVEACIRSDFRVEDVLDVEVHFKDGVTYVTAMVVPIKPGRPFNFKYYLKGVE